MLEALLVTLREGVEAALVVGIIVVFLRREKLERHLGAVWSGIAMAVAGSLLGALALYRWAVNQEAFEGVLYLASAVVVASMVVWMWRHAGAVAGEMKGALRRIVQRERRGAVWIGLFVFTFFMVVREGIETVLFLSALSLSTGGLLALAGAALGLAAAVVFGVLFVRGSLRVDLRRFFAVTGIALIILVVQLLLNGYHELSEAGWVPANERSMALVGPLVRNDFFFIAAVVVLPLLLLLVPASAPAAAPAANPAAARLERAEGRRQRLARAAGALLGIAILGILGLGFVYRQGPATLSAATPVRGRRRRRAAPRRRAARRPAAPLCRPARRPLGALHRGGDRRELRPHRDRLRRLRDLRHAGLSPGGRRGRLPALRLGDLSAEHRPDRRLQPHSAAVAARRRCAVDRARRPRARRAALRLIRPVPSSMFARLLFESLRRGRRRKLLALAAIGLGTAGLTALGTTLLDAGDRVAAELAAYGANLELRPAGAGETLDAAALAAVRRIFWRNNVVAVAPLLTVRARFEPATAGHVAPLHGTWFDHDLGESFRTGLPRTRPGLPLAGGRWPRDGAREVALGRRLAARLAVGEGDPLVAELGRRRERFTIVGVVGGGGE